MTGALLPPDLSAMQRNAELAQAADVLVPIDDPLPPEMEEQPDGSVVLFEMTAEAVAGWDVFDANIAEVMEETDLSAVAIDLFDAIERDQKSREKRDKQYEDGIRRSGLGDDAPGGANFNGASRVVHPIIAETAVDFAARAIREVFPPEGPVRFVTMGNETREKEEKRERVSKYMNYQLTVQMPEYRSELEQLLTQLPLGGSQYLKLYWDMSERRPRAEFVPVDDVFLPYAATNFYASPRVTHRQYLSTFDFGQRLDSGMYRDVDPEAVTLDPEQSGAGKASDKVEGREFMNDEGLRVIYEVYTWLAIDSDPYTMGEKAPYIVTLDEVTGEVLSIYRNWDEGDPLRRKLDWLVEYVFVPWRGAYGIGLPHLIGGLSAALTGALRALLDSAHINNIPTLLKLKGTRMSGQSTSIEPTQVYEIEGGVGGENDIRRIAMSMPFNQPSGTLFQLLGFLDAAARGVIRTTLDDEQVDTKANVPVGTQLSRVEQGMIVFSAIHGRLHAAQRRTLDILYRLNRMYLDDQDVLATIGEPLVSSQDFQGPSDVMPVSDPLIFSDQQRIQQMQAVLQLMQQFPQVYNVRATNKRALEILKIARPDELLINQPPEPKPADPVSENASAARGFPLQADPNQDHVAHLLVHIGFLDSPIFGLNPILAPGAVPSLLAHIHEHAVMHLTSLTIGIAQQLLTEAQAAGQQANPEQVLALASQQANQIVQQQLASLPDVTQRALTAFKQAMDISRVLSPTADPVAKAAEEETYRRAEQDKRETALREAELASKSEIDAARIEADKATKMADIAAKKEIAEERVAMDHVMNEEDNKTALEIAGLRTRVPLNPTNNRNPNPSGSLR
jgi:hypothetical protein